jgi:hypothetical protein
MWGQYRQLQVETQTWDGTLSTTVRWALLLVAVKATPPPPPEPEPGTREFQPDFETDSHGIDLVSTEVRPDAIVTDYRYAYVRGPKEIDNISDGHYSHSWRFRAEPGSVYIAREDSTGTDWRDEELLFEYTGAEITEIDGAFTETGTVVVAAERATGGGGSSEVHLYWYADHMEEPDYVWHNLGAGRSPRVVFDYFPTTVGPHVCPPETDVQLFYMKPGSTHAVRREQSSLYAVDIPIPSLSYNNRRRIHKAFRTDDRRVSLYGSDRNLVTGRYAPWRVDSVVYKDSLLGRPDFLAGNIGGNDLMLYGHTLWYASSGSGLWGLQVRTPDALIAADGDAIEVQARSWFPEGSNPTFPLQNQESNVDVGANGAFTFSFNMEYGSAEVNLVAFRARTRKVIGEITCYSPWRYTVLPASFPQFTDREDLSVNCDNDIIIDVANRMTGWRDHGLVEAVWVNAGPNTCEDDPPITTATPPDIFVGGQLFSLPGFPAHLPSWNARRRAWADINFTDLDGHYSGSVIGAVVESTHAESPTVSPKAYDWPAWQFPLQFPDDAGEWPAMPGSIDVVAAG